MTAQAHDYATGTRARKWLGVMFRPLLRANVRALLWLCPDTAIVANVTIGKNGTAITIGPNSIGSQIIGVRFKGQTIGVMVENFD